MKGERVCERLPSKLTLFPSFSSSQSRTRRSDSGSMRVATSPSMLQQRITEIDQQREELKIEVRNQSVIKVSLMCYLLIRPHGENLMFSLRPWLRESLGPECLKQGARDC